MTTTHTTESKTLMTGTSFGHFEFYGMLDTVLYPVLLLETHLCYTCQNEQEQRGTTATSWSSG